MTDSGQGSPLDIGKLPPGALQEWVLKRRGHDRAEVRLTAALGEDAAVLDLDDDWCVASVDPITGATSEIGWLAVHVSCNDVAAHGARPVAALLCVLLPEGSRSGDLAAIMEGAERAAREVEVAIVGGHTEVTPGLRQPIVTATVIGRVPRGRLLRSADLRPGDRVWMSKTAGLEGTAILAGEWADRLRGRVPDDQLAEAAGFSRRLSIVAEALAVCEAGATALHDVTEGGVLGALWEMAAAAGVGLEVWPDRIPVAPATRAICQALG
ncbi:MAG TPA: AIR synthase related protein, partial [Bacillota bacterium]